jgi:acetylornithine deacetylase
MEAFAREEVLPELREFAPEAEIVTETLARVPPLREASLPGEGGEAEALLRSLPGVRAGGAGVVSFATEGGTFQAAGISTVVCGPGSIDQAHRPDEFIEVSELDACARALRGLLPYLTERG